MANQSLHINGKEIPLSSDTKITLTVQVNDLADIKDRQASFTNQFRVPDCDASREVFESANSPQSGTTLPYKKMDAKIVSSGVEVISGGTAVLSRTFGGDFDVVVYDSLKKFFDLIGDKKLSDIDFSDITLVWDEEHVTADYANMDLPYVYPIINDGLNFTNLHRDVPLPSVFPTFWVKTLFDRIFSAVGYRYESADFGVGTPFDEMALPFTNSEVLSLNSIELKGRKSVRAVITSAFYDLMLVPNQTALIYVAYPDVSTLGWNYIGGAYNVVQGKLTAPFNNDALIYFKGYVEVIPDDIFGQIWTDINVGLCLNVNGTNVYTYTRKILPTQNDAIVVGGRTFLKFDHTFEYAVQVGDVIRMGFIGGNSTAAPNLNTFRVVNENPETGDSNYSCIGWFWKIDGWRGVWNINGNLPDIKQKDLIKSIANWFSHLIVPDNEEKVVRFVPMDTLLDNIPFSDDWSGLLAEAPNKVETTLHATDYARENWLRWKKDDSVTLEYGDYYFPVNDETLLDKKTIVEMPFAATDSSTLMKDLTVANVKRYNNSTESEKNKPEPRLVFVKKDTLTDILTNGYVWLLYAPASFSFSSQYYVKAYFESSDKYRDLRFSTCVPLRYKAIMAIMDRYSKARPKMVLPASVMSNIKPYHPKYIKGLNGYYYFNKAENWVEGQPITVELLRIN